MFTQSHRRKAQGCGGKDSGDGGHGHIVMSFSPNHSETSASARFFTFYFYAGSLGLQTYFENIVSVTSMKQQFLHFRRELKFRVAVIREERKSPLLQYVMNKGAVISNQSCIQGRGV